MSIFIFKFKFQDVNMYDWYSLGLMVNILFVFIVVLGVGFEVIEQFEFICYCINVNRNSYLFFFLDFLVNIERNIIWIFFYFSLDKIIKIIYLVVSRELLFVVRNKVMYIILFINI